jgi:peptidoglycan-N-acetylglucosamine deacetylase
MPIRILWVIAALGWSTAHGAGFEWPNGKRAAIVLTYDDALRSQLQVAVPQLDRARLKGTFFLDGDIAPEDMVAWRGVAVDGHELGNHSVFHPCPRAYFKDREQYAAENYSARSMLAEIGVMNNLLFGIDGKRERTYAYPCSETAAGGVDYTDELRRSGLIRYARTGGSEDSAVVSNIDQLDDYRIPSWGFSDGPSGARLIAFVKRAEDVGGLGVLMFHGVGGDYLDVSAQAHRELLDYLTKHPDIWAGTLQQVMDHLKQRAPRAVKH